MGDVKTMSLAEGKTHHACCIEVDGLGVLITGPSGSGKTSLAHGLIESFANRHKSSVWISDDRVHLRKSKGGILAVTPEAIEGKAELFGLGIVEVPFKGEARVDLVVEIVPDDEIERMPKEAFVAFLDGEADERNMHEEVSIRLFQVPQRHEAHSVRLVTAVLAQLTDQASKSA